MARVDEFIAKSIGGTQEIWKRDGAGPVLVMTAGQLGFAEKVAAALSAAWERDAAWAIGVPRRVITTSADAAAIAGELQLDERLMHWNIVADGADIVALNPRITDADLDYARSFADGWTRRAARASIAAQDSQPPRSS